VSPPTLSAKNAEKDGAPCLFEGAENGWASPLQRKSNRVDGRRSDAQVWEGLIKPMGLGSKLGRSDPQRLKAAYPAGVSGTAKVMPFHGRARSNLDRSFLSVKNRREPGALGTSVDARAYIGLFGERLHGLGSYAGGEGSTRPEFFKISDG